MPAFISWAAGSAILSPRRTHDRNRALSDRTPEPWQDSLTPGPESSHHHGAVPGKGRWPRGASRPRAASRGGARLAASRPGRDRRRRLLPGLRADVASLLPGTGVAAVLSRNHRLHHPYAVSPGAGDESAGARVARRPRRALGSGRPASLRSGAGWRDGTEALAGDLQHRPGALRLARRAPRDRLDGV